MSCKSVLYCDSTVSVLNIIYGFNIPVMGPTDKKFDETLVLKSLNFTNILLQRKICKFIIILNKFWVMVHMYLCKWFQEPLLEGILFLAGIWLDWVGPSIATCGAWVPSKIEEPFDFVLRKDSCLSLNFLSLFLNCLWFELFSIYFIIFFKAKFYIHMCNYC